MIKKEAFTNCMDVLESEDLQMELTESNIFVMKIQEDNKINYYLVHQPAWNAPDILKQIDEDTYNKLKQIT